MYVPNQKKTNIEKNQTMKSPARPTLLLMLVDYCSHFHQKTIFWGQTGVKKALINQTLGFHFKLS